MSTINAPFSDEQVDNLNKFQTGRKFHPFTCCSPEEFSKDCQRAKGGEGLLKATSEGWVCPCGKYTQDWAHSFMAEKKEPGINDVFGFITTSNK